MDLYNCALPSTKLNTLTDAERNRLVESCIPWCKKLARETAKSVSLEGRSLDAEDLEGEAYVACCAASKHWHPERGVKFITMATAWIRKHFLTVIDARRAVLAVGMSQPELVAEDRDESEPAPYLPNDDEARLLRVLSEPARSIVRMVVFEDFTPEQVAAQLGMAAKDVKLTIRNSASLLENYKAKESDRETNGLFSQSVN